MSEQHTDLVTTHFLEEINQIIAEIDEPSAAPIEVPTPPAPSLAPIAPSPAAAIPTPVAPASEARPPLSIVDLADSPIRRQVQNWWLSTTDDERHELNPELIVGACLRTRKGGTSPITGIDPAHHRVLTRSGSVYELGLPEASFAAKGRQVLRRLGL